MFHAAAEPVSHTTTLKGGKMGFVMRRLDLQQFLSNIQDHSIQDLSITELPMASPKIVTTIMAHIS